MKFSIKDFFSKCNQIRSFLWIWSHLLKQSLLESFIFCAALYTSTKICSVILFSQETFFQECDGEPQAEDNEAVQVSI